MFKQQVQLLKPQTKTNENCRMCEIICVNEQSDAAKSAQNLISSICDCVSIFLSQIDFPHRESSMILSRDMCPLKNDSFWTHDCSWFLGTFAISRKKLAQFLSQSTGNCPSVCSFFMAKTGFGVSQPI